MLWYIHVYIYIYICVCVCVCVCVHARVRACVRVYTYKHIHIYIHIIFNTNLLHNVSISYYFDMFWSQFLAVFGELRSFHIHSQLEQESVI